METFKHIAYLLAIVLGLILSGFLINHFLVLFYEQFKK